MRGLNDLQYDVIGNLDADVSFEDSEYVEFLMSKFARTPDWEFAAQLTWRRT